MDQQEIFVGRKKQIDDVVVYLQQAKGRAVSDATRFVTVQGDGGIGKTKFLTKVREKAISDLGYAVTGVIDVKATVHRSSLSFLQAVAISLNERHHFDRFLNTIGQYNSAKSREKYELYETALNTFVECCLTQSREIPIVILIDTLETIRGLSLEEWLLNYLPSL